MYSSRLIKLPTPRFVIFYNGTAPQPPKQVLRLSDAYEKKLDAPELELIVTIYNINIGNNQELLEAYQLLKEYAQYVEQVRRLAQEKPLSEAVEQAVEYCIERGILADFLRKNRAEAIAMSIFEYDEEKHLKNERKIGFEDGLEQGKKDGIEQSIQVIISDYLNDNLSEEYIIGKLQKLFQLSFEEAKSYYEKYEKCL